jgi:hypothetical protein
MSELLTSVKRQHAKKLFPLIYGTAVTETILWDGPDSLKSYESGFAEREIQYYVFCCWKFESQG